MSGQQRKVDTNQMNKSTLPAIYSKTPHNNETTLNRLVDLVICRLSDLSTSGVCQLRVFVDLSICRPWDLSTLGFVDLGNIWCLYLSTSWGFNLVKYQPCEVLTLWDVGLVKCRPHKVWTWTYILCACGYSWKTRVRWMYSGLTLLVSRSRGLQFVMFNSHIDW